MTYTIFKMYFLKKPTKWQLIVIAVCWVQKVDYFIPFTFVYIC